MLLTQGTVDPPRKGGTKNGDAASVRAVAAIRAVYSMKDKTVDDAITFGELYKGLKKSCCNVRWKDSVTGYEANGLKNTYLLRQSLLNGTYKISGYQRFRVHEPKEREIVATRLKDRQFQRSLCDNVLYPQITDWSDIGTRESLLWGGFEKIPDRIIDSLMKGAKISVTTWNEIVRDSSILCKLIDMANENKDTIEYDFSRPMRRHNS